MNRNQVLLVLFTTVIILVACGGAWLFFRSMSVPQREESIRQCADPNAPNYLNSRDECRRLSFVNISFTGGKANSCPDSVPLIAVRRKGEEFREAPAFVVSAIEPLLS
jgi:hypothetical protein